MLEVSEKVLSTITRRDNPQMVVGIFEQRYRALKEIRPQLGETYVALDRVRDPGNLGTIIRTADAAGASGIILVGETTDPFSLETVRATMGSVFAMPVVRASADDFVKWQKPAGVKVVATHLAGSVDYRTIDYKSKPVVLLMGNEQAGLPEELAREAGRACPHSAGGACRFPQSGDRHRHHAVRGATPSAGAGCRRMSEKQAVVFAAAARSRSSSSSRSPPTS